MKITRIGTYKTGFKYYKNKVEITNADDIEKIKLLKIPPAYENVSILNDKKIIAYGYDSKNRKQVLYNPAFIAKQNAKKYDKISTSIKFFSILKKRIASDLGSGSGSGGDEKTLAIAVIITLILTCGFRIGNKKYEKDNNSVGLTTLKYSHLKFDNDRQGILLIDFIGKKGVRNVAECDNKIIYEYLYNKYKNATSGASKDDYVFTYDGGKVITSADVNEYLKVISNKYSRKGTEPIIITTKDLRTWNANMLFLTYYKKLRKSRGRGKDAKKGDADAIADAKDATAQDAAEKSINKDIKAAIEMVAHKLHNSYSICRKSYIDPKIIEDLLSSRQS
jgi:DNA topoisomerase-1|uniref:DNA topoisomerase n=1 Tax=viral metagenome TaxID=1070528 RepID=A0A6C0CFB4_9ZZZZ